MNDIEYSAEITPTMRAPLLEYKIKLVRFDDKDGDKDNPIAFAISDADAQAYAARGYQREMLDLPWPAPPESEGTPDGVRKQFARQMDVLRNWFGATADKSGRVNPWRGDDVCFRVRNATGGDPDEARHVVADISIHSGRRFSGYMGDVAKAIDRAIQDYEFGEARPCY